MPRTRPLKSDKQSAELLSLQTEKARLQNETLRARLPKSPAPKPAVEEIPSYKYGQYEQLCDLPAIDEKQRVRFTRLKAIERLARQEAEIDRIHERLAGLGFIDVDFGRA